jgi:2-polyprenyl-6-methoxyphenol hydroxylase-like FAD-dependent oxidoreductase
MTRETDRPPQWDVAIVGAGPVGLVLAGELAASSVSVVVFERADAPSSVAKANGIVGHSALELVRRGVFAGTNLRVVSPSRFQFGPLALNLGVGPRNPLHILPIPQRRLEDLLEQRATRSGVQVHRGHEVLGYTQDDTSVVAEVRSGDSTTQVRARYLVGCDGAHSFVRKTAGISFEGFTSDQIARIARVTIPHDRITRADDRFDIAGVGHVAAMRPNRLPGGSFTIAPVAALDPTAPADLYLVSTHEPRGSIEPSDTVPLEELRGSLRRVLSAELPFTEATAIRSTVGNSRQADSYRHGSVFLAGDAAHVFNAGGSALNIGIQDALNLASRLIAVLRQGSPVSELDAYEATRRPAGERALHHTRVQAALARNDEDGRALRDVFSDVLRNRSTARSLARLLESA